MKLTTLGDIYNCVVNGEGESIVLTQEVMKKSKEKVLMQCWSLVKKLTKKRLYLQSGIWLAIIGITTRSDWL